MPFASVLAGLVGELSGESRCRSAGAPEQRRQWIASGVSFTFAEDDDVLLALVSQPPDDLGDALCLKFSLRVRFDADIDPTVVVSSTTHLS